jgi:hypothetical protein
MGAGAGRSDGWAHTRGLEMVVESWCPTPSRAESAAGRTRALWCGGHTGRWRGEGKEEGTARPGLKVCRWKPGWKDPIGRRHLSLNTHTLHTRHLNQLAGGCAPMCAAWCTCTRPPAVAAAAAHGLVCGACALHAVACCFLMVTHSTHAAHRAPVPTCPEARVRFTTPTSEVCSPHAPTHPLPRAHTHIHTLHCTPSQPKQNPPHPQTNHPTTFTPWWRARPRPRLRA